MYAFVAGTTLNITNVTTGAGVITVTTSTRHGLAAGTKVFISGIAGGAAGNNTTGNPAWTITPVTSAKVVTGASNDAPIKVTATAHGLATNDVVTVSGVLGNTASNGTWTITYVDADHFTLNGSSGVNSPGYVSNADATVGFANKFSLDGSSGSGSYTPSTGTVQVCAPVWQSADKRTAWSNSRIGPLDGASARPSAPVYADSKLRLAVYDSSLSLLNNVDPAQYGGFGVVVNVREDSPRATPASTGRSASSACPTGPARTTPPPSTPRSPGRPISTPRRRA